MNFYEELHQAIDKIFGEPKADKQPKSDFFLGIRYQHMFYGEAITSEDILPFRYTSETNRTAAGRILQGFTNEEIQAVLKEAKLNVTCDIYSFHVFAA